MQKWNASTDSCRSLAWEHGNKKGEASHLEGTRFTRIPVMNSPSPCNVTIIFRKKHMLSIYTNYMYLRKYTYYIYTNKFIHSSCKEKTSHFDHSSTMFHWTIFLARQLRADRHQASGEILYSRILSCCVNLAPNILGLVVLRKYHEYHQKKCVRKKHLAKNCILYINS